MTIFLIVYISEIQSRKTFISHVIDFMNILISHFPKKLENAAAYTLAISIIIIY